MPDLSLTFVNPRLLDDVSFHPCIRFKRWEVRERNFASHFSVLDDYILLFFYGPFRGRDVYCETPRMMPHCTSGWSLRWFHHRLHGRHRRNTLWLTEFKHPFQRGARNDYHDLSRGWDLNRRPPERNPQASALDYSATHPRLGDVLLLTVINLIIEVGL